MNKEKTMQILLLFKWPLLETKMFIVPCNLKIDRLGLFGRTRVRIFFDSDSYSTRLSSGCVELECLLVSQCSKNGENSAIKGYIPQRLKSTFFRIIFITSHVFSD